MSQTKQIALDHLNRLNAGDLAGAAALWAEDAVDHAAIPEAQGRAGHLSTMTKLRTAVPDLAYQVEDTLVDGDRVVLRVTATGTQSGPMNMVRFQLPASNNKISFEQIHIVRVANGKITEHWMGQDSIALFRQLGVKLTPPT